MSQIYITNGQTDEALTHIRYRNVLSNSHKKSLEDNSETFDFTTHADKSFSHFIDGMNRIIIPGEDNNFLEFIIYEVLEDRIKKELEIYSYASYAELITAKSISPHTTDALSAEAHGNLALAGTEWEMGNVDFNGVRTITFDNYTNPYAYLKRIASVFDLEIDFRIEHNNGNIIGRYVDLVEKVGQWRGRRVEFGKDLIGLKRIVNTENIVTALRVVGPVREDGTRLEVIVEDEEALQRWGRNGQHIIKEYEPQFEDIDNATIARLRELGEQELAKRVKAIVSYEGTIADLENVPGMENKKIRFGDTIQIKDTSYEPALYLDARIFFQDRDIKEQAEKIVFLGDFTEYTEEEVHSIWQSLQKQINEKIGRLELEAYAEPVIPEQDTPPSNPKKGDKWVDTSQNPPQLKLYDGEEWHAVKGEKGDRGEPGKDGYTPVKGVDYFDGKDGQDGTSSYLWVRYSQNANGNPMSADPTNAKYIGVATTETPSAPTSPTAYEWTLIKGSDGIPGEDGSDGRTSYLHIKYSNDGGQTFTGNNGEDVGEWIGTYVDFTQADSNNVNDYTWNKVKGEKGDKGDTGPRGATGERGPRGDAGTSVTGVTEYYLASSASSGVTTGTSGWTTTMQQMTPSKRYLWNYEKIHFSDDTTQNTLPVIIGVYGDKGDEGDTGRSIVSIEERYLATSASSGVTRSTSGWTSKMQQTTTSKRYLWNYEIITWNKAPLTTYIEPIIIGVHGETGPKGDKGEQGPQGIQGPKGEDGQSQYVHIRYSANSNGNPMTTTPQSNSKYIGLANTTSPTAPSSYTAYTWSLIRGADGQDGIPGPKGDDGQTTYTWVRYADDENGSGMSDSPHDKLYIGLAFNKTTPTESNNPSDYTWSLMPQNIEIGGRNLIINSDTLSLNNSSDNGNSNLTEIKTDDNGEEYYSITPVNDGNVYWYNPGISFSEPRYEGQIYTLSFDVMTEQTSTWGWYFYSNASMREDGIPSTNGEWIRFKYTFTQTSTMRNSVLFGFYSLEAGKEIGVRNLKLEKGNKATDWTPAPEDVQSEIDSVYQYASSEFSQLPGKLALKADASVVDGIESRVTTAELSIDGLEGQITSKVEANDVRSIFLQEAGAFTFSADQINFDGHVFGQNATFEGRIEGAEIVGSTFNQSGSEGSITLDQEGLKIRDASNSLRMILSTTNGSFQSFSPSSIIFEPNDNFYELVAGTGLPGLGDGFFGFQNSAPNRTLNMLNEGNGSSIQFFSPQVNIGGRLVIGGGLVGQGKVARLEFNTNRSSASSIYWNASTPADYGMFFNVDGNFAGRITSNGNWEAERNFVAGNNIIHSAGSSMNIGADSLVRITSKGGFNGSDTVYRPLYASEFNPVSLAKYKENIEKWSGNGLDIVNRADVHSYNLKDDKDKQQKYGFVIGEGYNLPNEILAGTGEAIDLYNALSIAYKAIQELSNITTENVDDINFLKMKNQYLEGKIEELERKIA